jgi:hypothetical protein
VAPRKGKTMKETNPQYQFGSLPEDYFEVFHDKKQKMPFSEFDTFEDVDIDEVDYVFFDDEVEEQDFI